MNVSTVLTVLTTLSTLVLGVMMGIATFRKTQAETAKLRQAVNPEDVPKVTSPQDSESKLLGIITGQLETAYKRCDDLSSSLEECRNRYPRRAK